MKWGITILLLCLSILVFAQPTCSDGVTTAQSIVVDFSSIQSMDGQGDADNNTGDPCFSPTGSYTIEFVQWDNIEATAIGFSLCEESVFTFGATWNVTFFGAPSSDMPCADGLGNQSVSQPLLDLSTSSFFPEFDTDANGCLHWEVYETFDGSADASDMDYTNGTFTFWGCPNFTSPVTIIDISAIEKGAYNEIQWTAISDNNRWQIVEKSSDGVNWTEVSREDGTASNNIEVTYTVLDRDPYSVTHYRIHSIDHDGFEQFSTLVSVFREDALNSFVAPNPFRDNATLSIQSFADAEARVLISDMMGKVWKQFSVDVHQGLNSVDIELSDLVAGTYVSHVNIDGRTHRFKISKM